MAGTVARGALIPALRGSEKLGRGVDDDGPGTAATDDDARQLEPREPGIEVDDEVGCAAHDIGEPGAIELAFPRA
jgi:hypothetical protein